jgi:UDP-N-acetylmuramate--alanine ligase
MRIGILFGGKSREREISFAGGRTVYDLLDKSYFEPVPIFVDSLGNFILLDWQYLYKGSIRDFYPPVTFNKKDSHSYQVYIESLNLNADELETATLSVGKRIRPEDLKNQVDFVFLTLHGPYGEDGTIQGILDFYNIPFSGSGILPSAIGINKELQKNIMHDLGIRIAASITIERTKWISDHETRLIFFENARKNFSLPVVLKASTQGSSIGVSVLHQWDFNLFEEAINKSFFIRKISKNDWDRSPAEKVMFIQEICDIYIGTGIPFIVEDEIIYHPAALENKLTALFDNGSQQVLLISLQTEPAVLIEEFIHGKEFSCIVVEGENGTPIALPPTEIIKQSAIFDYRAKYLPGISRKITPIHLPEEKIQEIIEACTNLYKKLHFDVYARIDGLIQEDGLIYLNDPNTTSGMLPSSFFFHQAAEIGLSPTQFLTYIIHRSLVKRLRFSHQAHHIQWLLTGLERALQSENSGSGKRLNVAVILGGYSTERHISVESGRNVYEKLASSGKYNVIPVFLSRNINEEPEFYILPMSLLLKDNADDIREKASDFKIEPVINDIIQKANHITATFASEHYQFYPEKISLDDLAARIDFAFLGLHGRPGEDGQIQKLLEDRNIPYNGSGPESSAITIDKYATNEILKTNGFKVPEHYLVKKEAWIHDTHELIEKIERHIPYPLIAKPSDDGCSSAVKKIKNRDELLVFMDAMFRSEEELPAIMRGNLNLKTNEEFPRKTYFVVEELIGPAGAAHFLEITGGMLTTVDENGLIRYELFEPSEALAQKGILSLEEKFLAGEGQNITPARFSGNVAENNAISEKVRIVLEKAARLLQIEGYARIDAFVRIYPDDEVEVIFIEVNSLPGLTPATVIFHQAAINGYKPFEFLDHIIRYGIKKSGNTEKKQNLTFKL